MGSLPRNDDAAGSIISGPAEPRYHVYHYDNPDFNPPPHHPTNHKWLLPVVVVVVAVLLFLAVVGVLLYLHRRRVRRSTPATAVETTTATPEEPTILVDMIHVPDWASEAAAQETWGMGQDTAAYHQGLYLTPAQREAVEALIQELPKFRLTVVPADCGECPICLEEFHVGNEVRGLPCVHKFHVECIDEWLRLNVNCPRCRCPVFPHLDPSALS